MNRWRRTVECEIKITRIAVHQITLPLIKPYRLSGGRLLYEALDSTVVGVETDAGVLGWGEGCPSGATCLPAFGMGVRAGLAEIAPGLLGQDPRRLDVINSMMDTALPGHPYVKSALDMPAGTSSVSRPGSRYASSSVVVSMGR